MSQAAAPIRFDSAARPVEAEPRPEPGAGRDIASHPADELVAQIHEGRLRVADLPPRERRRCVAHLGREGFTVSQIALLMHTSERSVYRDRAAIRRAEAIKPTRTLGDEWLGEFYGELRHSNTNLTRYARDESQPPYARIWAEEAKIRNYRRFLDVAYRLGYIEGGGHRLSYLRDVDPKETERNVTQRVANMQTLNRIMRETDFLLKP